ncbi:MAG TPA: hypothetical protein VNY05_05095 [Candidatus Acidoferrales bacterium]|jgi:hypothetical protein|nr:hypothetical protein [Candidatus Acidoferrales bacterium]
MSAWHTTSGCDLGMIPAIAAVLEKEVLSKHRKALMLMGTFHLMHGTGASAVSLYQEEYPNVTLAISDLGAFDTDLPDSSSSPLAAWPIPALARVKGTWMGKFGRSKTKLGRQAMPVNRSFQKENGRPSL